MKPANWITKLSGAIFTGLLACALAVGSFVMAPAAPAYADVGTPPPPDTAKQDERLAKLFQRAQKQLEAQGNNLTRASDNTKEIQAWIDDLKTDGKDTAALEKALADWKTQIAAAQAAHAEAAKILNAHSGFDANGKVVDRAQARKTLLAARAAMGEAAYLLRRGRMDFTHAVRVWRQANRPAE